MIQIKMKIHFFIIFNCLLSILIFGQVNDKEKIEYDYSLIVDCEDGLCANDFKFIINPEPFRKCMFYISYEYKNDSLTKEKNREILRIPLDTLKIELSTTQLDTIYSLTKRLFIIPEKPKKYDSKKFYPPMIYDGISAIVKFKFKDFELIAYAYPDTNGYQDFKRLLDKLKEIKTGL